MTITQHQVIFLTFCNNHVCAHLWVHECGREWECTNTQPLTDRGNVFCNHTPIKVIKNKQNALFILLITQHRGPWKTPKTRKITYPRRPVQTTVSGKMMPFLALEPTLSQTEPLCLQIPESPFPFLQVHPSRMFYWTCSALLGQGSPILLNIKSKTSLGF